MARSRTQRRNPNIENHLSGKIYTLIHNLYKAIELVQSKEDLSALYITLHKIEMNGLYYQQDRDANYRFKQYKKVLGKILATEILFIEYVEFNEKTMNKKYYDKIVSMIY